MKKHAVALLVASLLLAGALPLIGSNPASAKETFSERMENGAKHAGNRTEQIVGDTAHSTKRVGQNIANDTKQVGHRMSRGAKKTTSHLEHKKS